VAQDRPAHAHPPAADRRRALEAAYVELRRTVRAAGLRERRPGYYLWRSAVSFALLLGGLTLALAAPPTPGWTALATALIGFGSVQVGLIGHDAGHRAVFRSKRANWALGSLCWSLALGIGFWYWADRHNRHHAHTNDAEADPEFAGGGLIAFTEQEAAARRGWRRAVARYQAALSPLLLLFVLLIAFYFRVESWGYTWRLRGRRRPVELALLAANLLLWALPVATLGWRWAIIFAGSQAAGGLYLALVVAPNHKMLLANPRYGALCGRIALPVP
jgi:fatty acid desaturase